MTQGNSPSRSGLHFFPVHAELVEADPAELVEADPAELVEACPKPVPFYFHNPFKLSVSKGEQSFELENLITLHDRQFFIVQCPDVTPLISC